ncbi:hypothetical protein D3C79_984850 [compost metagenome]
MFEQFGHVAIVLPQAHQPGEFALMAAFFRQLFGIALIELFFPFANQLFHTFGAKQLMGRLQ